MAVPGFDLRELIARRRDERFALNARYTNPQMVHVLKALGLDRPYVSGQGAYLFDRDGNRYLDLLNGYGVFGIGRNHPTVRRALEQALAAELPTLVQMDTPLLAGLLAEKLAGLMPGLDKFAFCNSGAETVETAMKYARYATRRSRIVFCDHAYHGLTLGALSLNGNDVFRDGFGPLLPDCVRVPFNDLPALEAALASREVAAFFVEPIQGEGVFMPSGTYLRDAAELCRKHGTLFVADEVQTGMGRTGKFLAVEHWGVEPDMVLLAKLLSGGQVPVGAVACKAWIHDRVFDRMDRVNIHGSTFSEIDLAMAAGLAALSVLEDEKLVAQAAARGARIMADLEGLMARHKMIREVRGKGLMIGIEFAPLDDAESKAAWWVLEQIEHGLFCQAVVVPLFAKHRILTQVAGHDLPVIKLLPAYVIAEADCDWIRDAFDDVLAGCHHVAGAAWGLLRDMGVNVVRDRLKV